MTTCPWCRNPNSTDESGRNLCRPHLAEYEGISEAELDRSDAEQGAEYADAMGW